MPFIAIRGTFEPDVGVPDGDTVRFKPDNSATLERLGGRKPKLSTTTRTVPLRYEGIDTLEKAALVSVSKAATDKNLSLCGVTDEVRSPRGVVLARRTDRYGRVIAFLFNEADVDDSIADGASVFLAAARPQASEAVWIEHSVNFRMITAGLAYPAFFSTLFADLRASIAAATTNARTSTTDMWPLDRTTAGVTWKGAITLGTMPPVWPYLWRRLDDYTKNRDFGHASGSLDAFEEFLEERRGDERFFVLSTAETVHANDAFVVGGSMLVSMRFAPEDLVRLD